MYIDLITHTDIQYNANRENAQQKTPSSLVHQGMLEDCVKGLMRTHYSSITPIATTSRVRAKNKGMYYRKAKEEDLRKSLKYIREWRITKMLNFLMILTWLRV